MDKFTSDKPLTRRSSRTYVKGTSSAFLAAKENMKLKMKRGRENEFIKDDYAAAQNAKKTVSNPTGVVYDDEMVKHFCTWDKNYPECPERFISVMKR